MIDQFQVFDSFVADGGPLRLVPKSVFNRVVASDGKIVDVRWAHAACLRDETTGNAQAKFRINSHEWQTKEGEVTAALPILNLYLNVGVDFSRLFHEPEAAEPAVVSEGKP